MQQAGFLFAASELLAVACGISPEMEAVPLALGMCHLQRLLSVSWFSEYKLFTFLVTFILRYFILFCCNGEWDRFLKIYVSYFSVLVYENERDFCVLIFIPCDFTKFFISSRSFLVAFLGFSINMY